MTREQKDSTPREDEARDNVSRQIRWLYFAMVVFAVLILGVVGQNVEATRSGCIKQNASLNYFASSNASKAILTTAQSAQRAQYLHDLAAPCHGIWPFQ